MNLQQETTRGRAHVWALVLAVAAFTTVTPAAADAPTPQETALARALFAEGVDLADAGDWQGAADRFERAYALRKSPVIAFNLANAWLEVGRVVEATEQLRAITLDPEASPALRESAKARLADARPRLAYLTVRLPSGLTGVQVWIDDDELPAAALGVAAPIDPGAHTLTLRRGDVVLQQRTIELAPGGHAEELLEPRVPGPAPSPRQAAQRAAEAEAGAMPTGAGSRADKPLRRQWWLWTAVGAVVVAGVVTAVVLSAGDEPPPPTQGDVGPGVLVID